VIFLFIVSVFKPPHKFVCRHLGLFIRATKEHGTLMNAGGKNVIPNFMKIATFVKIPVGKLEGTSYAL
jgi:hypothetical protein